VLSKRYGCKSGLLYVEPFCWSFSGFLWELSLASWPVPLLEPWSAVLLGPWMVSLLNLGRGMSSLEFRSELL
jgi:hypothetical protein